MSNLRKILNKKPYIIAEIGSNHNGSFKLAKKLIKLAKISNCDAVKFQSWNENLFSKEFYKKNTNLQKQVLKYKLNFNQLSQLRDIAKKAEIDFGTTVFTTKELKEAVNIKCDFIKIASMDLNNYHLLNKISTVKQNVIVSTGFGTEKEIIAAAKIFKKKKKKNVIFLHCISLYPPKNIKSLNLKFINRMEQITGFKSGFSDHTVWPETLYAVCGLGGAVIEKHFTFNKKAKGWDHSISANPKEMSNIVKSCKLIQKLLGNSKKKISKEENNLGKLMRRSIYVINSINKNSQFTEKNVALQRPAIGIAADKFTEILGKKAYKNLEVGDLLKENEYFQ